MILSERRAIFIIFIAIFIYIAVLGAISVLRHYNFQTQAWDMGIFLQTFWNTSQGRIMQNSIEEVPNHFGVHTSPILFLLVPGFFVFPSAYYLLIIQTLALALGALPFYLFAKKILGRNDFALLISVGYLLYPSLHRVNLFDFHPISFLPPFLFAAIYFFYEKKWLWFWVFTALAASAQEDAVLAVLFFGLFLSIINLRELKERNMGALAAAAMFAYFIISVKFLMPAFGGGLLRLDRYGNLGGSFPEILRNLIFSPALFLKTVFTAQKMLYLFWLFLPVLFLPFIYWPAAFLLAPGLLQSLLTDFQNQFSGLYQYDAMIIAGVFIGAVFGMDRLLRKLPEKAFLLKLVFFTAVIFAFLFRSPLSPLLRPAQFFEYGEREEAFREIVKTISPEVSVAANTNLVPHLAKRERIYMAGSEPSPADAVIIDGADLFGFEGPSSLQQYADSYALSGEYDIQIIKERYFVFTKASNSSIIK